MLSSRIKKLIPKLALYSHYKENASSVPDGAGRTVINLSNEGMQTDNPQNQTTTWGVTGTENRHLKCMALCLIEYTQS